MLFHAPPLNTKLTIHLRPGNTETASYEYAQHTAADGALACFVPVQSGDKMRVIVEYEGMARELVYDVLIDGVLVLSKVFGGAKAAERWFEGGKVYEGFLFVREEGMEGGEWKGEGKKRDDRGKGRKDGVEMGDTEEEEEGPEIGVEEGTLAAIDIPEERSLSRGNIDTVGVVEVRVSVARADDTSTYDIAEEVTPFHRIGSWGTWQERPATYSTSLRPTFQMRSSDHGVLELSEGVAKARLKKLGAKRPGREPWAVGRFFYRSKEAIKAAKLPLTYMTYGNGGKVEKVHVLEEKPMGSIMGDALEMSTKALKKRAGKKKAAAGSVDKRKAKVKSCVRARDEDTEEGEESEDSVVRRDEGSDDEDGGKDGAKATSTKKRKRASGGNKKDGVKAASAMKRKSASKDSEGDSAKATSTPKRKRASGGGKDGGSAKRAKRGRG